MTYVAYNTSISVAYVRFYTHGKTWVFCTVVLCDHCWKYVENVRRFLKSLIIGYRFFKSDYKADGWFSATHKQPINNPICSSDIHLEAKIWIPMMFLITNDLFLHYYINIHRFEFDFNSIENFFNWFFAVVYIRRLLE